MASAPAVPIAVAIGTAAVASARRLGAARPGVVRRPLQVGRPWRAAPAVQRASRTMRKVGTRTAREIGAVGVLRAMRIMRRLLHRERS